MIQEVTIKNFKSVQDLTLPLSRFNVFIGSNGSGKSNILEGIAFGAAAAADKLDNEFLGSRGIRTSEAKLMKSIFVKEKQDEHIEFGFKSFVNNIFQISIQEEASPILKWQIKFEKAELNKIDRNGLEFIAESRGKKLSNEEKEKKLDLLEKIESTQSELKHIAASVKGLTDVPETEKDRILNKLLLTIYRNSIPMVFLSNFCIYSPENSALRKLDEESQILPLGIKGEGLFNVLQIFNESYSEETLKELKDFLHIIEWFDDFEAVNDQVSGRKSLIVKDRYIPDTPLNQNNVNEGFLFLLLYVSLIISKETPDFFAIDNIEASFHPRLCEELTRRMVELCKKHNKQVIITTHNPAVLDGLNLDDPDQSLFVIRRNADGATIADKIDKQPKNVKLSEAWERGYIGGQPETIA